MSIFKRKPKKKWYEDYQSGHLLTKEEKEVLDNYTEDEFNIMVKQHWPDLLSSTSKIYLKDVIYRYVYPVQWDDPVVYSGEVRDNHTIKPTNKQIVDYAVGNNTDPLMEHVNWYLKEKIVRPNKIFPLRSMYMTDVAYNYSSTVFYEGIYRDYNELIGDKDD